MTTMPQALAKKVWAVVGATNRTEKFGYKIYQTLKQHGYEVYPVNPGLRELEGDICYASLAELPKVPEVVDLVVPAQVGVKTVADCATLGIPVVWMQPGADKPEVVQAAQENGLDVIQACVIVELREAQK